MRLFSAIVVCIVVILFIQAAKAPSYDIIIRQGTIYDGSGSKPFVADVGIRSDTIAFIGDLSSATAKTEIDAKGLSVAPGFINMLSMAERSLLMDGRSMSDIMQGVTLEVMGEGWSAGPVKRKSNKPVDSLWTTLDGYFKWQMKKGTSTNVASFVGATTIRNYVLGHANRKPTAAEQEQMNKLVQEAMEQGAMGVSTSLIYAPADFASTEEIISLASEAARYKGMYITHMRSESDNILKALNETFRVAREANIRAEIYHLKINHDRNWNKIEQVLEKIDSAQKAGLKITANMYPYAASNTALTARLPNWVQEGGAGEMRKRLKNPATRKKVLEEMRLGIPTKNSDPKSVVILGFRLDSLNKLYRGKRLDEVAAIHGKDADETLLDLLVKDRSPGAAVYHLQTEENVRRIFKQPYVSFGSDGASFSDAKIFDEWGTHPRAFGTFARAIGKYGREEKLVALEELVRRMTSLPATNLGIKDRGRLRIGYYADLAIFDAKEVIDRATYDEPKLYATGMRYVLVNGVPVLSDGAHTGAMPGRVVRGPGWRKK
ncbi:MAG TPA: D-aminoacylase [Cyclobacteriaceae bacterium]|nr:D-aminoacylase [Cyclobacteriaceae bacterium]HMV10808.1 D-aminoacylase [Cyclobacteriaceae bacterium]HMV88767.1 D-aminoacylase [Cyclobacteriaceae bacterium]HMX02339.1 D-aminoacylase [Cyclobacteriaceae bacterium]HMX51710.1 D-aminoacylase [Cyclobacteriaceae bacterium]